MRRYSSSALLLGTLGFLAACASSGGPPGGSGGELSSDSGDGDGDGDDTQATTESGTSSGTAGKDTGGGSGDSDSDTEGAGSSAGEGNGGNSAGGGGSSTGGSSAGGSATTGGSGSGGEPVECDDEVIHFDDNDVSGATIAVDGEPCTEWGALGCGGANDKRALFCDQGQWIVLTECDEMQSCDRLSGVCTDIIEGCQDKQPGESFCDGDLAQECGPDRVNLKSSTSCCGLCQGGTCEEPFCGDGKVNLGELCDDGNDTVADGCEPDCKSSGILALTGGEHHSCALLVGGHVRCWGGNEYGQLGQGHTDNLSTLHPYQIPVVSLGSPALGIDAGRSHTCALMESGQVQCWGRNEMGQLGLGHTLDIGDDELPTAAVSTAQLGSVKAMKVSAGGENACALMENQTLRCWGRNNYGQLGLGHINTIGDNEAPTQALAEVQLGVAATDVAVGGGDHICAVPEGEGIKCWGYEMTIYPDENIGDDEPPSESILYSYGPTKDLVAGGPRACGILIDAGHQCLGYNGDAGLALGLGDKFDSGHYRWEGRKAWQLAMGVQHTCVSLSDFTLRCFGYNDKAQLGIGDTNFNYAGVTLSLPADLGKNEYGNPSYAVLVAAGEQFTCALTELGDLHCWGLNNQGQLGLAYVSPGPLDYVGGTSETVPSKQPAVRLFP